MGADRSEIEHGVESRHFQHADLRHAEHLADVLDRLLRQPAAGLLLRPPQQGNDRRGLAAFGIFGDLVLGPGEILRREGEARGLILSKAAGRHRSCLSCREKGVDARHKVYTWAGHRPDPSAGHDDSMERRSHRSTSPNTMSSEPSTADTSASIWPRQ